MRSHVSSCVTASARASWPATLRVCGALLLWSIPGKAQDPQVPDSSPPPVALLAPGAQQLEVAVRLRVGEIKQAIERADSACLDASLPPLGFFAEEPGVSRQAGCPSLGAAVRLARGGLAPAGAARRLALGQLVGTAPGPLVVIAGAHPVLLHWKIMDVRRRPARYAVARFEFERVGQALVLRRALGLLAALCGLAVRG